MRYLPSFASASTLAFLLDLPAGGYAQANVIGPADFSTWFNMTEFPNAQASNVSKYMSEAVAVSQPDLFQHFLIRCVDAQKYPAVLNGMHPNGFIAPARPFQSLFFVGQSHVSSWAVDTGDGLVIIDTLDNPDEVKKVLLPGLETFGYTGHDIKAVLITHEHSDHYGGAGYLQSTFGMSVYASEAAWTTMALTKGTPKKDKHSDRHTVGFYGGGGIPSSAEAKSQQVQSFSKFSTVAQKLGADVLLSNHQDQDQSIQNFDIINAHQGGGMDGSHRGNFVNPFVIGVDAYSRYLKVMQTCVRVQVARINQFLTV
ncbi:hypothetical protein FPSE_09585 [Fusarium pseudograminearum CS3096]|uniref:Metallo-beta-lactamase domain-containing protein n=1 Tax=Fusarium pseudograminearum (strain CS3096) TaxID=1028729 RepID=K3UEZ9_FUSPC|nr:hypothetical protein FPSE_09585 [Fusarium pseudograminearum CS3096]EKJ70211.1 hypothetical protein FPSE_09585 [Fusarium pseudograminearum CS3096]